MDLSEKASGLGVDFVENRGMVWLLFRRIVGVRHSRRWAELAELAESSGRIVGDKTKERRM